MVEGAACDARRTLYVRSFQPGACLVHVCKPLAMTDI